MFSSSRTILNNWLKCILSSSRGLRLLQMVSELDTELCVSKDARLQSNIDGRG